MLGKSAYMLLIPRASHVPGVVCSHAVNDGAWIIHAQHIAIGRMESRPRPVLRRSLDGAGSDAKSRRSLSSDSVSVERQLAFNRAEHRDGEPRLGRPSSIRLDGQDNRTRHDSHARRPAHGLAFDEDILSLFILRAP